MISPQKIRWKSKVKVQQKKKLFFFDSFLIVYFCHCFPGCNFSSEIGWKAVIVCPSFVLEYAVLVDGLMVEKGFSILWVPSPVK